MIVTINLNIFPFQSVLGSLMSFFKASDSVPEMDTHWFSESGIIDTFVMLGPKPHDVFQQYASLTGTTPLPPVSQSNILHAEDLPIRLRVS